MKRLLIALAIAAGAALAQEHGAAGAAAGQAAHAEEHGDPLIWWKWANFAILMVGLGYLVNKNLPPFFHARTQEIRKGIADAARIKSEADAKAAEMDARMARLSADIDALRAEAKQQIAAEGERMQAETRQLIEKIHSAAEQEIAALTRAARMELRAHAAGLAIELAGQRLRGAITPETQGVLVDRFVGSLERARLQN
ncbi:MAG: ATP synthase F0 subunit B [Bryobacteraceae bacterium]|nr:ATP synthase F0 subunit B [Bryobacteraceae bacterium]